MNKNPNKRTGDGSDRPGKKQAMDTVDLTGNEPVLLVCPEPTCQRKVGCKIYDRAEKKWVNMCYKHAAEKAAEYDQEEQDEEYQDVDTWYASVADKCNHRWEFEGEDIWCEKCLIQVHKDEVDEWKSKNKK